MQDKIENITKSLENILLSERALLLQGRAKDILALAEDKHTLMRKLEAYVETAKGGDSGEPVQKYIKAVVNLAKENEIHFLAVRNGVGRLIARLRDMNGETQAGFYNQHGDSVQFNGAVGGYLKKV